MSRYLITLPDKYDTRMKEIIERTERTMKPTDYGEVIKRSIALYNYLVTNSRDGIITYTDREGNKIEVDLSTVKEDERKQERPKKNLKSLLSKRK